MNLNDVPKNLFFQKYATHLVLRRRRFDPIARLFFTIFIGIISWFVGEKVILLFEASAALWTQVFVGLATVLLYSYLVYVLISIWINWTYIYASVDRIEVRQAPLPVIRYCRFEVRDIRSIYVYRKKGSHYGGGPSTGVALLFKNGLEKRILTLVYPAAHAEFIVDVLQQLWGMGDFKQGLS